MDVDSAPVSRASGGTPESSREPSETVHREEDGFADWARPSLLAMTRLARRVAPDAESEDVVQEALTRAWLKWPQYDARRGTATTWLLAITADQARAARRARVRRLRVVAVDAAAPTSLAESPDLARDADLDAAIRRLPPRQRLAVDLYYFVGLPVEQTAAVMGCTAGTVKSTLHDARGRLRLLLGETDD